MMKTTEKKYYVAEWKGYVSHYVSTNRQAVERFIDRQMDRESYQLYAFPESEKDLWIK